MTSVRAHGPSPKARDDAVRAFRRLYRENRADFPAETREAACEEQMRRAYPLHPEVLKRFSGDWSGLEKFQRTRGILNIMADAIHAIHALRSGESAAPLISPARLPFRDTKVRSALLDPLDRAFGPILQSEVDGERPHTARIEDQRPRLLKARAATLAARAEFFAAHWALFPQIRDSRPRAAQDDQNWLAWPAGM